VNNVYCVSARKIRISDTHGSSSNANCRTSGSFQNHSWTGHSDYGHTSSYHHDQPIADPVWRSTARTLSYFGQRSDVDDAAKIIHRFKRIGYPKLEHAQSYRPMGVMHIDGQPLSLSAFTGTAFVKLPDRMVPCPPTSFWSKVRGCTALSTLERCLRSTISLIARACWRCCAGFPGRVAKQWLGEEFRSEQLGNCLFHRLAHGHSAFAAWWRSCPSLLDSLQNLRNLNFHRFAKLASLSGTFYTGFRCAGRSRSAFTGRPSVVFGLKDWFHSGFSLDFHLPDGCELQYNTLALVEGLPSVGFCFPLPPNQRE